MQPAAARHARRARYCFDTDPVADAAAVVQGDKYRFSVLTDGVLRCEWAEDGVFEDRPSAFAIRRRFAVPEWSLREESGLIEISTSRFRLEYRPSSPFGRDNFVVYVNRGHRAPLKVPFDAPLTNLGGTRRTLDTADGRIPLDSGVLSRDGLALLRDSRTMLFTADGWLAPRREGKRTDFYLWAYGHAYRDAMRAFYAISGSQPLLPRYALGNWWSRYHAYTQDEYLSLMSRFDANDVPVNVAVLDMEWHKVDIPPQYGNGWTGYSWNRDLFPDPPSFLDELHRRNLKVTLNDHPAEGIRPHEDMYDEVAKAMGYDPSKGKHIKFDCTNRKFMDASFDIVHHQLEDMGVDFWWVDWQQGSESRLRGVDPLWVLNHYHFLDIGRANQRPLMLSRWAGPGSQRYPVGFSGDTVITWKSLDFQPEFTATASNIGYGWWSHDIGGHMHGEKDDELTTRWVQLGCFSPMLRLHCSNNIFNTREPWAFSDEACRVMKETLRLRHRLIPYLYSMNVRGAADDEPLVQPMYWQHPDVPEAYTVPNQFRFGSELIVAPITKRHDKHTHLASAKAWLPLGRYVDIFTGVPYDGHRTLKFHRPLDFYPVLAPEGAIVPLDAANRPLNGSPNPDALELLVVVGADGFFDLVEDDGTGSQVVADDFQLVREDGTEDDSAARFCHTPIRFEQATGTLTIGPTTPSDPSIPETRTWAIRLLGYTVQDATQLRPSVVSSSGEAVIVDSPSVSSVSNGTVVHLGSVASSSTYTLELGASPELDVFDPMPHIWSLIWQYNGDYDMKETVWPTANAAQPVCNRVDRLRKLQIPWAVINSMTELLAADGRYDAAQRSAADGVQPGEELGQVGQDIAAPRDAAAGNLPLR